MMPKLLNLNAEEVKTRIQRRDETRHLDYFDQLVPADKPIPQDKDHFYHLQNIAGQLLLASWQPLANQFYSLIFFLLQEPNAMKALVDEVRDSFPSYDDIDSEGVPKLKFLQACVLESLRLHQDTVDGLPRVSPGALVDGTYIPKGVSNLFIWRRLLAAIKP
jgi:cytochrome P450